MEPPRAPPPAAGAPVWRRHDPLLLPLAGLAALALLIWSRGGGAAAPGAARRLAPACGARRAGAAAALHPALLAQVRADLAAFNATGISLQMVEQAYCHGSDQGFRLQVVGGRAYVAGEAGGYQSRHAALQRQLAALAAAGALLEGLDVVIEQHDDPTSRPPRRGCPRRGPLLAPTKRAGAPEHAHVVLAPDFSFGGWPEAHVLPWAEELPLLAAAGAAAPWGARAGRLFFRGAATGRRAAAVGDPGRLPAARAALLDVQLTDWARDGAGAGAGGDFVPLPAHCGHKLLLHLPGNSYSSRLKWLMACGSAVAVPTDSPWAEFWYGLLRPGVNVAAVNGSAGGGLDLAGAAAALAADDAAARALGAAGAALVQHALAPARVAAYWEVLLREYRALQTFAAGAPHADAAPLFDAVASPRAPLASVRERTCGVCVHGDEGEGEGG